MIFDPSGSPMFAHHVYQHGYQNESNMLSQFRQRKPPIPQSLSDKNKKKAIAAIQALPSQEEQERQFWDHPNARMADVKPGEKNIASKFFFFLSPPKKNTTTNFFELIPRKEYLARTLLLSPRPSIIYSPPEFNMLWKPTRWIFKIHHVTIYIILMSLIK